MSDLRRERARIRRALREKAGLRAACIAVSDVTSNQALFEFAEKEQTRLVRQLRTGRAIGPLTSAPRKAGK